MLNVNYVEVCLLPNVFELAALVADYVVSKPVMQHFACGLVASLELV